jgi:hypothetical protein
MHNAPHCYTSYPLADRHHPSTPRIHLIETFARLRCYTKRKCRIRLGFTARHWVSLDALSFTKIMAALGCTLKVHCPCKNGRRCRTVCSVCRSSEVHGKPRNWCSKSWNRRWWANVVCLWHSGVLHLLPWLRAIRLAVWCMSVMSTVAIVEVTSTTLSLTSSTTAADSCGKG